MKVFKPTCPNCGGRNTTIRTSKSDDIRLHVHYCDCLEEDCLTRFVVESTTTRVLSTLNDELKKTKTPQLDQIPLNLA